MRKKSNKISTIIFIIMLILGLSVMLYPTISDWWNSKVQSYAVAGYQEAVANLDDGESMRMLLEAEEYNKRLAELYSPLSDYDELDGYDDILNISGTGIMGFITIPVINVELPIYHGTSAEVLNVAAGHLQGSSFPIGGENTHAVISAHRGLPSAKLFTDLDRLVVGDTFTITILDTVYTYEVEEILIVKPEEVDKLAIISGGDYVTLMTCTPYGINSHRLLIRSHRTATVYEAAEVKVTADAVQVDPMLVVPLICAPLIILLLAFWIFGGRRKTRSTAEMMKELIPDKKDGE
jgi:sortase A